MIDQSICTSSMTVEEANSYKWFVKKMTNVAFVCRFMPANLDRLKSHIKNIFEIYYDSRVFQAQMPEIMFERSVDETELTIWFKGIDGKKIQDLYHYMKDPNNKCSEKPRCSKLTEHNIDPNKKAL